MTGKYTDFEKNLTERQMKEPTVMFSVDLLLVCVPLFFAL